MKGPVKFCEDIDLMDSDLGPEHAQKVRVDGEPPTQAVLER